MSDESRQQEWKRRARLARIFGDVLPETTADERDPRDGEQDSEGWLKSEVPPHHGE
jgi:hypothetical protein